MTLLNFFVDYGSLRKRFGLPLGQRALDNSTTFSINTDHRTGGAHCRCRRPPSPAKAAMARILVTDGDLAARRMIELTLRRHGFRVIATPGGPALEAVEAFSFDAMIVDLPPAGGDDIDAIHILRRNAPDVPIIAVTRSGGPPPTTANLPEHAARLGVACCLQEPFTPGDLVAAVEACLARRRERPGIHRQ